MTLISVLFITIISVVILSNINNMTILNTQDNKPFQPPAIITIENSCEDTDPSSNFLTGGSVTTTCNGNKFIINDYCISKYLLTAGTCEGFDKEACLGQILNINCGEGYECMPYPKEDKQPGRCVFVGIN